jgi:hypothetical protein
MGSKAEHLPRPLNQLELTSLTRALELSLPDDAIVKAVWWPGVAEGQRNYRLTAWTTTEPRRGTWLVERLRNVYRLRARPADADELGRLLDALRDVRALEPGARPEVAQADYDCSKRSYQLCFTLLEDMREGTPYKRWILRRHHDDRPLSVGYLLETRRGNGYATLPGGATLRGSPWSE